MSHFGSRAVRIPDESRLSHELEPQMEHRTRIPHLDILLGACLATREKVHPRASHLVEDQDEVSWQF